MKAGALFLAAASAATLTLAGCASGPNQNLGTGLGAVGGAAIGNLLGGDTAATLGGAALGGVIGNQIGRHADERNYYPYHRPPYSY